MPSSCSSHRYNQQDQSVTDVFENVQERHWDVPVAGMTKQAKLAAPVTDVLKNVKERHQSVPAIGRTKKTKVFMILQQTYSRMPKRSTRMFSKVQAMTKYRPDCSSH